MKGKIAYLNSENAFELMEQNLPETEDDAVLIKVLLANICGSDVKNWHGGSSVGTGDGNASCQGHEFVGEIVSLGKNITVDSAGTPVKVGDRVTAPYYITCGECPACKAGHFNMCENAYIHLGLNPGTWPHFGGAFATHYYIFPKQKFYRVPDSLPDNLAVGANCAFSQVYFTLEKANLQAGETILIQGAGGLGLYAAAVAKEKGAKVIVIDGVKSRLEMAKRFGADHVIDLSEVTKLEDRLALTKEYTDGRGPEVCMEVTGFAPAFEEGIQHLAVMGRYMIIGINTTAVHAEISPGYITRKALTVQGVVRYNPEYLHKSLEFLDKYQDKYPFKDFSDTVFSLEELGEAMQQSYDKKITRAVIKP